MSPDNVLPTSRPPWRIVVCGDDFAGCDALAAAVAGLSTPGDGPYQVELAVPGEPLPATLQALTSEPRGWIDALAHADAAVVRVDAERGLTRSMQAQLLLLALGRQMPVLVAIDRLDRIGFSEAVFVTVDSEVRRFAAKAGLALGGVVPVSATGGDNLQGPSSRLSWFSDAALCPLLTRLAAAALPPARVPMRILVEGTQRQADSRLTICGRVGSGTPRIDDRVRVQPSGRESRIAGLVRAGHGVASVSTGDEVALELADAIDVAPGTLLSSADSPAEVADQFECTIVWTCDDPLLPGRAYRLRLGHATVGLSVTEPKYRYNLDTLEHVAAKTLARDEVGVCNIALEQAVAFDPWRENRATGGFVVLDRHSDTVLGAGLLHFALRRAHNIHRQHLDIDKAARASQMGQRPMVLWFTGLSGSGKSTIANLVEKKLFALGRHSYLLDGDNVRHGLNKDLGFTAADRVENIRRIAEVAKLMADAGLIVLTAFISPFRAEREMARGLLAAGEFVEIHVDTPLEVAEQRDVKGLYRKARRGELRNFTGIDSPYEAPEQPELRLDTVSRSADEAAEQVLQYLRQQGVLSSGPT